MKKKECEDMFIKKQINKENMTPERRGDKFLRELNKSIIAIKFDVKKEEDLRKKMFEDIRKGELRIIPA